MKPEDMRESMGEEWYARAKQIEAEADLQAALSTISTQAARIKELEGALKVCRQSLIEQAEARADPTMPLLTAEVVAELEGDAEATYALASTRAERVTAHGLSLLCEWQRRARNTLTGGNTP